MQKMAEMQYSNITYLLSYLLIYLLNFHGICLSDIPSSS